MHVAATEEGMRAQQCHACDDDPLVRLRCHADHSEYVSDFLRSRLLEEFLADDALRALLGMRKAAKELSEAYGAAAQVDELLRQLGCAPGRGRGVRLLDVCSGRGLTGTVLSMLLPEASVVLLDANGGMDLRHVASRPNLTFVQLDLFDVGSADAIGRLASEERVCVAIGVHLCGSLSPRLIDLAIRVRSVSGVVVSPCCLQGRLGSAITREARRLPAATSAYHLATATLAELCRTELSTELGSRTLGTNEQPPEQAADADELIARRYCQWSCTRQVAVTLSPGAVSMRVRVTWDTNVLSPKNAFIAAVTTSASGGAEVRAHSTARAEATAPPPAPTPYYADADAVADESQTLRDTLRKA